MTRAKRQRSVAFHNQDGRCFYCNQPMWLSEPDSFAKRHGISLSQAQQFRCTAEHLRPKVADGTLRASNVAAACWHCNRTRGKRTPALDPAKFRRRVQARCRLGKWHSVFPEATSNVSLPIR